MNRYMVLHMVSAIPANRPCFSWSNWGCSFEALLEVDLHHANWGGPSPILLKSCPKACQHDSLVMQCFPIMLLSLFSQALTDSFWTKVHNQWLE